MTKADAIKGDTISRRGDRRRHDSPAGALNLRMTADLQSDRAEARTQRTGRGGDRGGMSFMIQGTTSSPKFVPDLEGVVGNVPKREPYRNLSLHKSRQQVGLRRHSQEEVAGGSSSFGNRACPIKEAICATCALQPFQC